MPLLLALFLFTALLGAEEYSSGSLVVSYKSTDPTITLDRIRFWLKKDGQLNVYPKKNSYIDDPLGSIRKVVIENLDPGQYTLQFIAPNRTGHLEDLPIRQIEIVKDSRTKIDVVIKPKIAEPGNLIISYSLSEKPDLAEKILMVIKRESGEIVTYSKDKEVPLNHGKMITIEQLTPGNYSIEFYIENTLIEARQIEILSGKSKTLHQELTLKS